MTPIYVGSDLDLYDVSGTSVYDISKLIYFGLSVFWRGAIHEWLTTNGLKAPEVALCAYEEPIRKFLMGEGPQPQDVVLTADIWLATRVLQAAYPPAPSHLVECQCYWFYVPGIIFRLYFGQRVPATVRKRDARNSVVGLDVPAIKSIFAIAQTQVKSRQVTQEMKRMLDEVAVLRAKQTISST